MKYAVCWISILDRKIVYEIYDSKAKRVHDQSPSHLKDIPIVFIDCTPEDQRLWNARLIIWTD